MKKPLRILIVSGIVISVVVGCGHQEPEPVVDAPVQTNQVQKLNVDPNPIKTINEMVKSANANLPVMVDKQTRLDKVVAGPGAQLTYLYTLPDLASSDVSASWITVDVKPKVTRDVCDTPLLRRLLANGATLVYAYKGKDGVDINQFRITDGDCMRIGFK